VAGTIYTAIHYAISSNFLLISAIKFQKTINTAAKPSLVFPQCLTPSVKSTFIKILHKHKCNGVYRQYPEFTRKSKLPRRWLGNVSTATLGLRRWSGQRNAVELFLVDLSTVELGHVMLGLISKRRKWYAELGAGA
jgi:hypothetical protein